MVRKKEGGTEFIKIGSELVYNDTDFKCEPIQSGSLVLIHGNVVHKSGSNTTMKSRIIYTFHVIEGAYEYPKDNWLQTTEQHGFSKILEM